MQEVVGEAWCKNAAGFVSGNVIPYESHYANYRYKTLRTFNASTTSVSEIENSATKRTRSNPNGVSPNQSLADAMRHMAERATVRQVDRDRRTAANLESAATWSRSPTAGRITPHAETLVMEEYLMSGEYHIHQVDEVTWWVLRKVGATVEDGVSVPRFKRVRELKLDNDGFLMCSCCYYERNGTPCRHQIAVNGLPEPSDVAVRWHRTYSYYYAREGYEDVTKAYNAALSIAVPGPKMKEEGRARTWEAGDAIIEEMRAVKEADGPVLVGTWAGTSAAKVATKEMHENGIYVKTYELSREGGFEQVVSLLQRDEGDQKTDAKRTDAYKDAHPILVDMCEIARNNSTAAKQLREGLGELHSKLLRTANQDLKIRSSSDGNGGNGLMSCGLDGLDQSSAAKRLKPGGEK